MSSAGVFYSKNQGKVIVFFSALHFTVALTKTCFFDSSGMINLGNLCIVLWLIPQIQFRNDFVPEFHLLTVRIFLSI